MTQNEIIDLATQVYGECVWHESALLRLEAFVKLIAAREREECAKVCGKFADEALVCGDEDAVMCFEQAEDAIRARGEA